VVKEELLRDRFSLKVYNFWYPCNKLCKSVMCLSVIDLKVKTYLFLVTWTWTILFKITQHFHSLIGCNKDQLEVNIETRIAHICDVSNVKLPWQWTYILLLTSTWTILFRMTQRFQILSEFNECQIKVNIGTKTWNLFGWDIKMTFKSTFQRWF
jgi:hypothetical protein